jgi:glycine cleavage system regulatory protein
MQVSLVLTVIGPDRPGLVERLAQIVARHGGNWLESRMAHLEGQFAGLLRVQLPATGVEELRGALLDLEDDGIRIVLSESAAPTGESTAPRVSLELVGHDRPGIVREISAALAVRGINVEEFESRCTSAPMSGEALFHARAQLRVPDGQTLEEVRTTLEKIANELMVDVTLEPSA